MDIFKYNEYLEKYNLIKEAEEDQEEEEEETTEGDVEDEEEEMDIVTNDAPEVYIVNALKKIQRKLEKLFDNDKENVERDISDIDSSIGPDGITDRSKVDKKDKDTDKTLSEMGASLEASDIIRSSSTHKSLVMKFSQVNFYYSLYIQINLKQVLELMDKGEELSDESIQRCYIKMKKINMDSYEEVGSINRNVYIAEVDESLIVDMKLELDSIDEEQDEEGGLEIEI